MDVQLSDGNSLRAGYLIGCDGGRSLVRKVTGIDFPGWEPSTSALIAEAHLAEEPEWGTCRDSQGLHALSRVPESDLIRLMVTEQRVGLSDEPTPLDLSEALIAVYGTVDLITANGPTRLFSLLHQARPLLLNLGAPGAFDIAGWADRVQVIDARYEGVWELPVIGAVDPPGAVLVRPDGHVAWVGDVSSSSRRDGVSEALTRWFGSPVRGQLA